MPSLATASATEIPYEHVEVPASLHGDAREAARMLLNALLRGKNWPGEIRRAAEDTVPPKELATADDIEDLLSLVELTGTNEPFLPLPYRISEMLGGLHCTLAVLGNVIGRLRGIAPQTAVVDTEHATLSASGHFLVELDGTPFTELWQKSLYTEMPDGSLNTGIFNQLWSQHFRCKDGRAIFLYQKWDPPADLLRMIGFKADEIPALIALTDPKTSTREQRLDFQARLASHIRQTWDAFELEKHIIKTRIGAAMVPRSRSEFLASPQGQAVGRRPPLEFHRTSGFPAVPFTQLRDPSRGILSGIKVVELTRALMGSRIGAILGYFGATVVKATSPFLSDYGVMSAAHNAGKLSVFLDLAKEEDREKLRALIRDADVFVTNYALGALDRLGFGYSQVLDMIKGRDRGIVYCEGNAFGFHGELATAAGFEHLAHALSGLAWGQGVNHAWDKEPEGGHMPAVVPINFIDKGTGHIGAVGAITALLRRSVEGGSFRVQFSLVQSAGLLFEWGVYPGLEIEEPAKKDTRHWLHSRIWPRYPPEELHPDPDNFTMYIGYMMATHLPSVRPTLFKPEFFEHHTSSPFGRIRILKPPLSNGFAVTPMKYRVPPRPIGHDSVSGWEEAEAKVEGRRGKL